jgi:target of rapamycin complex subunit LST8
VYVWKMWNNRDITTVTPTTKFSAHNKYLTRCLLSSDVKHLATCSADTTAKIWSTENDLFRLETTLEGHQRWVWDCAFSADSAYLVTGQLNPFIMLNMAASSDHIARLWELSSGKTIRQYSGHHKGAVALALNDCLT